MNEKYIRRVSIVVLFFISICSCSVNNEVSRSNSTITQISNTNSCEFTENIIASSEDSYQSNPIILRETDESINDVDAIEDTVYYVDRNTSEIHPTYMSKEIKYVDVDFENTSYASIDGIVYSKDLKTLIWCPANYEAKTIILPEIVEKIGPYAFYGCNNIDEIIMGESVWSIDIGAFSNCESLKKIELSPNLLFLGEGAFQYCKSLEEIILPESLFSASENGMYTNTVGCQIFSYCASLKRLYIPTKFLLSYYENPSGFYEFGNNFVGCNSLKEIELSDNVPEICIWNGSLATSSLNGICKVLPEFHVEKFTIPNDTVALGLYAFEDCTDLKELIIMPYSGSGERKFFIDGERTLKNCYHIENLFVTDNIYICNVQREMFPNLTFYTLKGSFADAYATEYGFPVVYVDDYEEYLNIPITD